MTIHYNSTVDSCCISIINEEGMIGFIARRFTSRGYVYYVQTNALGLGHQQGPTIEAKWHKAISERDTKRNADMLAIELADIARANDLHNR